MKPQHSPTQNSQRETVMILVCPINGRMSFHFCSIKLLQGINSDLWWPLPEKADLFSTVEQVMTVNGIAHNVTEIRAVSIQGKCTDYQVTFNRKENG